MREDQEVGQATENVHEVDREAVPESDPEVVQRSVLKAPQNDPAALLPSTDQGLTLPEEMMQYLLFLQKKAVLHRQGLQKIQTTEF
jgi:hypothetical protein